MMASATMAAASTSVVTMSPREALALGALATVILIALLIVKELLLAYASETHVEGTWRAALAREYARTLTVAILPLLFIFGLVVATRVADVL